MKKNLGSVDAIVRISLAILVAVLYAVGAIDGTWALVLGLVAVIFLATSFVGFCPIYYVLKVSTKKE